MKLKANTLEKIINDEINDIKNGCHDSSTFAIYYEENYPLQVKVTITIDDDDFCSKILPKYENGIKD